MRDGGAVVAPLLNRFDVIVELLLATLERHVAYAVSDSGGTLVIDVSRGR